MNFHTKYVEDMRSRPTLDEMYTYSNLYECMEEWSPAHSSILLRMLQDSWSDTPSMRYCGNTNYYYIYQLVRNVATDQDKAMTFAKDMEKYCYFEKKTGDTVRNTYISEARRWWRSNNGKREINPIFRLLGAENMVETYLKANTGNFRAPTKQELDKYHILTTCITNINPYLSDEDVPSVEIDLDGTSKYSPLQFATRIYIKNPVASAIR